MKKLQNNFTTPEQSKRLLELGVPADSADICYTSDNKIDFARPTLLRRPFSSYCPKGYTLFYLPCWSAGRLIEIYELCCNDRFGRWNLKLPIVEDIIERFEYINRNEDCPNVDFSKLED